MNAVEMVKAALAEAGYPNAHVYINPNGRVQTTARQPWEVSWRAGALVAPMVGKHMPCWPCWSTFKGDDCDHDTFDGAPPVVRP